MKQEPQTNVIFRLIGILFLLAITVTMAQADDNIEERPTIVLGIIKNATATELTDVQIVHQPSGSLVGFSPVLPGSHAELGIPPQKLISDIAIVSWTQLGELHKVTLDLPTKITDGHTGETILLYTVHPSGDVTAELKAK